MVRLPRPQSKPVERSRGLDTNMKFGMCYLTGDETTGWYFPIVLPDFSKCSFAGASFNFLPYPLLSSLAAGGSFLDLCLLESSI